MRQQLAFGRNPCYLTEQKEIKEKTTLKDKYEFTMNTIS